LAVSHGQRPRSGHCGVKRPVQALPAGRHVQVPGLDETPSVTTRDR
jgi:hypothetical protein